MKKFLCIFFAAILLCTSVCQAADYLYFSSGEMTQTVDGGSIAKLGDVYYATDAQGRLWMTQIFTDWLQVHTAPANCRLISNQRADADKLLVYADATLYASYDGVSFTPVKEFAPDAVLRYTCGLYTAAHKTDGGFALRYSFDGVAWYDFPAPLTQSTFTVLRINDSQFVLKGIQTANGQNDVLLNKTVPENSLFFSALVYDVLTGLLVESPDYTGAELVYADAPANGRFLYIYREHTQYGYRYQVVRTENGSIKSSSAVLAGADMQLYAYGDTLCLAQNGKSLNFINTDTHGWVQVTDDIAFPMLRNAYALCGDVFFDAGYTAQYYCRNTRPMPVDRAGVEVNLKGSYLAFDSAPQILNDRTMVPVRAIAEALGCTVAFDETSREIRIQRADGVTLYMTLGANMATKVWADGVSAKVTLDASPVIVSDRTLVPLRFVSENLDLTAEWNADTKTVVLK